MFNQPADDIFGRSILGADTIGLHFRNQLVQSLDISRTSIEFRKRSSTLVARAASTIADHYFATEMAAYLAGFLWMQRRFPEWLINEVVADNGPSKWFPPTGIGRDEPPPAIPPLVEGPFGDDAPEPLRFPKIEEGAKRMRETNILTRPQFDEATDQAKARAFTVAGDIEENTIQKIRDVLADNVDSGTSFKGFRDRLGESLRGSFLGPHHLETVYRTNVQAAFRDGRHTLMSNPIVAAAFPYQAYFATRDDRVRDEHAALQETGLNGTNIYRMDDPFWDHFTPPWDYNCRCTVVPLSLRNAAASGVTHPRRLSTFTPPVSFRSSRILAGVNGAAHWWRHEQR
jgi:SPP1 gp7 family putative phage head morphogenesis protein